jgi:Protein of unknown function (DUF2844)
MITRNRILVSIMAAVAWQSCAWAGLGGTVRSVGADRQALRGGLQSASNEQYSMHVITTDGGTTVNEYANPQGTVFAISWDGPMAPNLQQLLGTYFAQYQSASTDTAAKHPGNHRHLSVVGDDLVVQSSARQRNFHGKAFIRSLVPSGLSIDDLL